MNTKQTFSFTIRFVWNIFHVSVFGEMLSWSAQKSRR